MGWVHAMKCLFLTIKAEVLWFSYTFLEELQTVKTVKTMFRESENSIFALKTSSMWQRSTGHTGDFNQSLSCGCMSAIQIPPTDTQIKLCAKRQRLWHNVQNKIILPAYMAEPQHFTIKQILKWICGSAKRPCHSSVAPSPLTVLKEERLASNH